MLKEFAVEPAALANPSDCRAILDLFVMGNGAFICDFPRRWQRMAYECAAQKLAKAELRPLELKRIVERLKAFDKRLLLPSGREYQSALNLTWRDNALRSNDQEPFGALIFSASPDAFDISANTVRADELAADHPLLADLGQATVSRKVVDIASTAALLVRNAKHIKFVEPNFKPGKEFEGPLKAVLAKNNCDASSPTLVELHSINESTQGRPPEIAVRNSFETLVKEAGATPHVIFHSKSEMHDRFLLTDRGGIMIGVGFDRNEMDNNTSKTRTTVWVALKRLQYETEWKTYALKDQDPVARHGRHSDSTGTRQVFQDSN
jgi:hypothetical protein